MADGSDRCHWLAMDWKGRGKVWRSGRCAAGGVSTDVDVEFLARVFLDGGTDRAVKLDDLLQGHRLAPVAQCFALASLS